MKELKNIASKLLLRIPLIFFAMVIFDLAYVRWFWMDDIKKEAPVLNDVLALQDSCQILYFGESSNFSYHPTRDSLHDRISDFISYHLPNKRLGTVNSSAYHAGIFVPLIQQIHKDSKVEAIIVTMNMRTFDQAVRHSELESSLRKAAVMYAPRPPLLNRLLVTLNYYDNTSAVDRDFEMWKDWTYDTLKSNDTSIRFEPNTIRRWCEVIKFPDSFGTEYMPKRALADHYIKAYAFQIDDENPRVKDFDRIVAIAQEKNIKLVFNLLAENVEYADSLVGKNLVWLMQQNRDFLVDRYSKRGVLVVDNLQAVGGYHYTDQVWTTEHYDAVGRKIIAQSVADSMCIKFGW
ncbi:MAG: hypothetical protein ACI8ZN_001399 [Bacteroidia bacterium]